MGQPTSDFPAYELPSDVPSSEAHGPSPETIARWEALGYTRRPEPVLPALHYRHNPLHTNTVNMNGRIRSTYVPKPWKAKSSPFL